MNNYFPKFRAWVKSESGDGWFMSYPRWIDLDNKRICTESGLQPKDFILMQSTGFKDNLGAWVYDGDIIQPKYGKSGDVFWFHDRWVMRQCVTREYKPIPEVFWVIGNIHSIKETN